MSDIYAHPTITSSPDFVQALQERLGLLAIVQGSRVQLVDIPPRWRYRDELDLTRQGDPRRKTARVSVADIEFLKRDG